MRKFPAAFAAILVLLSACGAEAPSPTTDVSAPVAPSSPDSSATGQPDGADDVSLTFMNWFYEGPMQEAYDGYIASFVDDHPQVAAVEVETQPFPRYHDVINVRLAADQPPDVSWLSASVGQQYVQSGRLVDLMPFIERVDGFNLDDFPAESLEPWMDGERLVALPFTNANNVLYYNVGIFEEAGIPTPLELYEQGELTWETLKETAAQLVESGAADYGFYFNNGLFTPGWRNLIEVFAPYGARPWSADGSECTFDEPEAIEATQLVWDMIYVDQSHPGPGVAADFAAGNVGMTLARQNFVGRLTDVPFEWEVTTVPEGPEGYVPSLAQNGIVAWADAPNPSLAAEFVVHTMTPENAARFAANTPSVRRSLQNVETLTSVPQAFTEEQLERAVLPSLRADNFELEYSHPSFAAIDREATVVFDSMVWVEDANISDAMSTVCQNIEPLLAP